jgi:AraC family transcriptional regulator
MNLVSERSPLCPSAVTGFQDDAAEHAVLRAIGAMQDHIGDQLTVDDLARAALFSKFHFTRIFQRVTGVSPGRFLSALRLQKAKELLISTPMKVADISVTVGYNSVGTFSSRFSRSVGMSPTTYRRHAGYAIDINPDTESRPSRVSNGRLNCNIDVEGPDDHMIIFMGVFPDRIPEGRPVRCAVLREPGSVRFDGLPLGQWYVLAQAVSTELHGPIPEVDWEHRPVSVATSGPITVRSDSIMGVDLILRPSRALDPPVLLALLDARRYAMEELADRPVAELAEAV